MKITARTWLKILLLALPVMVAAFAWPTWAALVAVLAWLLAAWFLTIASLRPPAGPAMILETIAASHYAEKVRWCLDRLELDYEERVCAGTLGVFFAGRTVPLLHVRTGVVTSRIGNSAEILRYLWGAHGEALGARAEFLRPTAERMALEQRLDAYGVDLQRWVYGHILPHRSATLRAWGVGDRRIPAWQRWALVPLFPVIRALMRRVFRITPSTRERVAEKIEALLGELDARLAENPGALLAGGPDYTDLTLAALSALWLQPDQFARGAGKDVRLTGGESEAPASLIEDQARWRERYPALVAHVERLYADR